MDLDLVIDDVVLFYPVHEIEDACKILFSSTFEQSILKALICVENITPHK